MMAMGCLPRKKPFFLQAKFAGTLLIASMLMLHSSPSNAQEENLARDLANPLSTVWSIANQFNFNQLKGGLFRDNHTQFNWNFQPVMPIPFNGQYNIVNRMVIPYYKTPYVDVEGEFHYVAGIGNVGLALPSVALLADLRYASGFGDTIWASLITPNKRQGLKIGRAHV